MNIPFEDLLSHYLKSKYNIITPIKKVYNPTPSDPEKYFKFTFVYNNITNIFYTFGQNQTLQERQIDVLVNQNYPELFL